MKIAVFFIKYLLKYYYIIIYKQIFLLIMKNEFTLKPGPKPKIIEAIINGETRHFNGIMEFSRAIGVTYMTAKRIIDRDSRVKWIDE